MTKIVGGNNEAHLNYHVSRADLLEMDLKCRLNYP